MNQVLEAIKIREVRIKCSICGEYFITKIFPDRTYKGGHCFRSLDPEDKTESWECDECFK